MRFFMRVLFALEQRGIETIKRIVRHAYTSGSDELHDDVEISQPPIFMGLVIPFISHLHCKRAGGLRRG